MLLETAEATGLEMAAMDCFDKYPDHKLLLLQKMADQSVVKSCDGSLSQMHCREGQEDGQF